MTTKHPLADLLILAANNKDQLFECDDIPYECFSIQYVLKYPEYNWRPVKTTKKIKRWLWSDGGYGLSRNLYTEEEAHKQFEHPIKLTWSETIFEVIE